MIQAYVDEPRVKDRLPRPSIRVVGKRVLIYQDPIELKIGLIYKPRNAAEKQRATRGTIIGVGEGYDSDDPDWQNWECPYRVGDRVFWGRWQSDVEIKCAVGEDWWDSPEEKRAEQGQVAFVILHVKDILGLDLEVA